MHRDLFMQASRPEPSSLASARQAAQWYISIFVASLSLGIVLRFLPATQAGFPVGDGGLFYRMVEILQSEKYALPDTVPFNGLHVPFAYPPIGFYLAGFVAHLTRLPLLDIFQWMPSVISTLTIPAFYLLADSVLHSRVKASLSMLMFALLPRATSWFIMGGGITRSLGMLFLILSLYGLCGLFQSGSKRFLGISISFAALVVLTHPEAALHAVATSVLLWFFLSRSKPGVRSALLVALGVLLLIAPWLLIIISRHGLAVFWSAIQTGLYSSIMLLPGILVLFGEEQLVGLISALALLGLLVQVGKRQFLLPAWLLLPWLVEPRAADASSMLSLCMLAALALTEVVLPGLSALAGRAPDAGHLPEHVMRTPILWLSIGALVAYSGVSGILYDGAYPAHSVSATDRSAMQWIRQNIAADSRFLILTGNLKPFSDGVAEWFPVLAISRSLNTVQGYEWLDGAHFAQRLVRSSQLQTCLQQDVACIEDWAEAAKQGFEYVYLSVPGGGARMGTNSLGRSLAASPGYEMIYDAGRVQIFRHRKAPLLAQPRCPH